MLLRKQILCFSSHGTNRDVKISSVQIDDEMVVRLHNTFKDSY